MFVRAGVSRVEGCPVTLRTRAFVVDQGTAPTIEHTIVDRQTGATVDIAAILDSTPTSASASQSQNSLSILDDGPVPVRIDEWFGGGKPDRKKSFALAGYVPDEPAPGVVRLDLPAEATALAGIYRMDWGIRGVNGLALISKTYLIVEASNFGNTNSRKGPPTLAEIREALRDSDPAENFQLDDLEFGDEQTAMAIARPVALWNDTTPQMTRFDTTSFPYREPWIAATIGFLLETAAHGYRRDTGLVDSAGGVTVKDKDKEGPYMAEARRRIDEYQVWTLNKKNEIGMGKMFGHHRSQYSSLYRGLNE